MSDFHALKVAQLERLTPNAVAISFEIPQDLKDIFSFRAGQYITVRQISNGEEIRRAYSIASSPEEDLMTIGVKQVPNGRFSVYANTKLKEGDTLEVMPPEGRFKYEPGSKADHIVAFAAGSGITPIMSIVQNVLESRPDNTMVLVYGNKSADETMFLSELIELQSKYTDRFFIQFVYSRTLEEGGIFGRIEGSTVNFITRNKFKERNFDSYYICGPDQMIDTVSNALTEKGVDEERIYTELFSTPDTSDSDYESQEGYTDITVVLDDEEFNFKMDKNTLVLDAVLDKDIDAPYSCQGGVCSTCIAKVTEGKAIMENNQILTDGEIADGLILTCQAHPTTSKLKVDYDDV